MGFSKQKRGFPPSWRRSCPREKFSRSPSTVARWRSSALRLQLLPSPSEALPAAQIFGWRMTSTIRSKRLPLSTAHHDPPGSTPSPGSCSLLFCNCSTPKSCSTPLTAHPYTPALPGPGIRPGVRTLSGGEASQVEGRIRRPPVPRVSLGKFASRRFTASLRSE